LVAGRSGEVNGWGLLDAREEHETANARDQVFRAVPIEQLTQLRFRVRRELGLEGKRVGGRVRLTKVKMRFSSSSSFSTSR
jgi:hypothetical protein